MHVQKSTIRGLRTLLVLAGAAAMSGLHAQEAATPAASPASAPAAEASAEADIITLSPFEVSGTTENGYVATDSLAGTRIRTDLKDIASAISVVTKELMNDIGATDSGTLLQYTTNTEVAGTRGTYSGLGGGTAEDLRSPQSAQRVRGLAPADVTRDYFVSDIPWDSYNVDRIDILRGPNSFLFGLGSPAGIQNASIQAANFKDAGQAVFRTGSYGSTRFSLNVNQDLIHNVLAIRVAGLLDHEKFRQDPAFEDDERIYAAVRFDPSFLNKGSFRGSFKVKYEAGEIDANRPRNVTPFDSITPFFQEALSNSQITLTGDNPFGGLGRAYAIDPYSVERTDGVLGDGRGVVKSGTPNYNPWLGTAYNAQQPFWTIDGTTGQTFNVQGGWINAGAYGSNGQLTGVSAGVPGKLYSGSFYQVNSLSGRASASGSVLPLAKYGGYRSQSLLDSSIFDFYNNLIDGPNKNEWQRWTAYNIDFSQTGWDDRIGLNLTYDRQRNTSGNQGLLGWGPTLNIDLNQTWDYTYAGMAGNVNFGRPFVKGAENSGGGSLFTDREYHRASLFAELRTSDLTNNRFLVKLLGKHRFNGVYSKEKYYAANKSWQLYANAQDWAGYWNANSGASSAINDRPPGAIIYLGDSIINRDQAAGAYIPRIGTTIDLVDSGILVFDPTPKAGVSVSTFGDPWTAPSYLSTVFNDTGTLTQASNIENLIGWNTNFKSNLMRYDNGADERLLTKSQKLLKKTLSYAGSYQGYFWNDALVGTLGWRFDTVRTKGVTAQNMPSNRNSLNLDPDVFKLPDADQTVVKGHSFNYQGVLHLNKILKNDPLPLNISLSYAKSSNFQATTARKDLYGNPIDNPSGETKEYGVLLGTKNGKYSLRVAKYETSVLLTDSLLGNASGLGSIISNGLNWRNVFLYELGGYDYASRNQPSYRNRWTNAYPSYIQGLTEGTPEYDAGVALANGRRDQAIRGWNEIQQWLEGKGFFKAWNFNPTGPASSLVDRATYLTNPTQYAPDTNTVYSYAPVAPQGFAVTADTISKGYEMEFVANPLPNLRLSFNASKTEASRTNVGGASLTEFMEYMDSKLYDASSPTGYTAAGEVPRWGGSGNAIAVSVYAPWKANYTKMKLQEGTLADEIRVWRYNMMGNYSFSKGKLKGAGIGLAYRWQDKVAIGYPVTSTGGYDLASPYYGPSEDSVDTWLSYERKLSKKVKWKIQLNVRNLFATDSVIPTSVQPDGHTWATVRVAPAREWFLTNTFSF